MNRLQYEGPLITRKILKQIGLSVHFKKPLVQKKQSWYNKFADAVELIVATFCINTTLVCLSLHKYRNYTHVVIPYDLENIGQVNSCD
jgi:hypothetical protein